MDEIVRISLVYVLTHLAHLLFGRSFDCNIGNVHCCCWCRKSNNNSSIWLSSNLYFYIQLIVVMRCVPRSLVKIPIHGAVFVCRSSRSDYVYGLKHTHTHEHTRDVIYQQWKWPFTCAHGYITILEFCSFNGYNNNSNGCQYVCACV